MQIKYQMQWRSVLWAGKHAIDYMQKVIMANDLRNGFDYSGK